MRRRLWKIAKITGIIILMLTVLSVVAARLVQRPDVQKYLVQQATEWLSDKLHTQVSVGHVDLEFFKKIVLRDVYIADLKSDTLFYAGNLKADISVFSIVRRKVYLKVVSAGNVVFNLTRHRGEKDYNLQFIINALADTSKPAGNKYDVQLSSADFHNIRVRWLDEPNNTDMLISVLNTSLDINKIDFNKLSFDIHTLSIDSPVVRYTVLVPPAGERTIQQVHPVDTSRIFLPGVLAKVGTLKMNGGRFYLDDLSQVPTTKGFDPFHIHVAHITFNLQKVKLRPDSIVADFKQFTAYETHGFTVRQLTGHARMTAFKTEMSRLYLLTEHSELGNYFSMRHRSFYDYTDYINSMYMEGRLKNSKVSFKDIGFFAPDIDYMKEDVYVENGNVTGPVNRLYATQVKMHTGKATTFEGDIGINGLPDIEETFFDANAAKFSTNEEDMKLFYPGLKLPDNLKDFGNIQYTGTFSGFYNDFATKGNLTTEHGNAFADVVVKLDPDNHVPGYSAIVSTNGLDLGKLFGNDALGNIDLNGEISGSGFSSTNDSTVFHGIIKSFAFNNYTYKNIALDGRLRKKMFDGQAGITDENISLFFKGVINLNKARPEYKFTASVSQANLRKLSFYKDDITFTGDIDVNGTGNNIDDALGNVKLKNIMLTKPGKKLVVSSLSLVSDLEGGKRIYTISVPKIMQASISGYFVPTSLPAEWLHIANQYIPALKLPDEKHTLNPDIAIALSTQNISDALSFFIRDIKGFDNSQVKCSLKNNILNASAFIPSGAYKKNIFNNNYLSITTIGDSLDIALHTSRFYINSYSYLDSINVKAACSRNSIVYSIAANNDATQYRARVGGDMLIADSDFIVHFSRSEMVINGHSWKIDAGNTLLFKRHNLEIEKFYMHNKNQTIYVQTDSVHRQKLDFVFKNVQLGDYYNIFHFGGVQGFGNINGTLSVRNLLTKPLASADIQVTDLTVDKDTIGDVSFISKYDPETEKISIASQVAGKNNNINAEGYIYTANDRKDLLLAIDVVKVDLKPASDFLKDFVSAVKGTAEGKITVKGTTSKVVLSGNLLIPNGELTINYLKTHYRFSGQKVHFTENAIELADNDIYDIDKNKAHVTGAITHKNFGSWGANLDMSTNKLQVLNTGEIDNDLFYGRAFASGTVKMRGPFDNMTMDIALKSEEGTSVAIPINSDQGLSGNDFIRFVRKDTIIDKEVDSAIALKTGIKINMDLEVTPKAEVKIIFDKKSGDIIDGTGSGNLRMEINTAGDFKMYGTYTIDNGNYLFTLPALSTNKYFNIDRGGTVSWSGDPYGAIIDISAIYQRRVLMDGLVTGTAYEGSLSDNDKTELSQRLPVSVYLKLNGSLFEPNIDFDIIVPREVENTFGIVSRRLQEIKQDKNELNKQVFGLLIFNKFLPPSGLSSSSSASSSYTSGALESTVGEFFANQLSYWLSQINSKTELNVNYYGSTAVPGSTDIATNYQALRQAQVELSQKLFNDKLKVVVGGNIDFGTANGNPNVNNNNSSNFAGDFLLEYQLTDNVKLGAYRRTQYDYTSENNRIRSGGKLSYKLEFDKWGDWRKNKKIKKPISGKTPTATGH